MEKTTEEIKATPGFWERVKAIKAGSKKIGYPFGGTTPEAWVARQADLARANDQKAYKVEEIREMAACEAAEAEYR